MQAPPVSILVSLPATSVGPLRVAVTVNVTEPVALGAPVMLIVDEDAVFTSVQS